jgi:hypothetical protein
MRGNRDWGVVGMRAELARKIAADIRAPGEHVTARSHTVSIDRAHCLLRCGVRDRLGGHRSRTKARDAREDNLRL